MENEITTPQSPETVSSPQNNVSQNIGASDASPFQQSANADALKQNTTLQVAPNGKPVTTSPKSGGSNTAVMIFVIVSSIVLVMIASSVFRWIMKQPEKSQPDKKLPENKQSDVPANDLKAAAAAKESVAPKRPKPTKNKKKQSRSKRNKK